MAEGGMLIADLDYRRAARVCRKAIQLDPLDPCAYHNLGVVLSRSRADPAGASRMYLKAMAL